MNFMRELVKMAEPVQSMVFAPDEDNGEVQSSYGGRFLKNYHMNIFYSDEDDGYTADIPDLGHCSAFGETQKKALPEVLKAKDAWLESARAKGGPIPDPHYRPVIYQVA